MWKFTVIVVLAIASVSHVAGVCNECKNGFACISETEFQLCFDGELDRSQTYSCPDEGDVCAQYGRICMPKGSVIPACRGKQNCVCDEVKDFQFVCTSRTTFTMCRNSTYTETRGTCRENQLCNVQKALDGEVPCVTACIDDLDDSMICDFEDPVDGSLVTSSPTTSTVTPSTVTPSTVTPSTVTPSTVTPSTVTPSTVTPSTVTPSTGTPSTETPSTITPTPPNTANEVCLNQTTSGRFPYPNDTACTNYVFCHWESNQYIGRDTACPLGKYFNRETRNCQTTRPTWCVG